MVDNGAHLTTSRVNRLLRPLRNKCNSLAALPKAAVSRVTYLKQPPNWDPDGRPPLTLLYLSTGAKRGTLDRCSADDFELSRRMHAVCDAFKNVVHVAFGRPRGERIPSLAAICTLVVGENMPTVDPLADSDEDSAHDILDVDGIYEAVPLHYRRFLIVSHALSMILCRCIHHHTLLTFLLDHCLSFGLVHESTHLLTIILAQAFLPSDPSCPPHVLHPGHTNYLLDLYTKWITGNKLSGSPSDSLLFTTSAFCHALLDTLSKSTTHNSRALWTSKVLDRLLHAVQTCDVDSYILIVQALSRGFWETLDSSPDIIRDDTQFATLRDKLSELISNLFDLLFIQPDSHSPPLISSRISGVIDVLYNCHVAGLHCLRSSAPGSPIDLPDVIIVFTTYIYVALRSSVDNLDRLLAILDDSSPTPATFSKLMVHLNQFQGGQAIGDFIELFLSELKLYSSALRSENLFKFDASLWACALRHFETSIATSLKNSPALVARYKRELMDAVDKAERRCFGRDMDDSPVVSRIRSTWARHTHRTRTSGNWEWEDMVGAWIQKTPAHKKRKIDGSHPQTPLRHNYLRQKGAMASKVVLSSSFSTPLLDSHRHSTLSPSSFCSRFSDHESSTEDGSEYQEETDKENHPVNPPQVTKVSRRLKRRSSNFLSLLADAQTNRIVLHPKARPKPKPPSVIPEKYVLSLSSQESRHTQHKLEQKASRRRAAPPPPPPPPPLVPEAMPLSDDSLNLFVHATSSPHGR